MKGYSYPGNSPLKGKGARKREAGRMKREEAMSEIEGAWGGGDIDLATDLMKSEGFSVNATPPPTPNTLAKGSPTTKRSPAKVGGAIASAVVGEVVKETAKPLISEALKETAKEAAITAGVEGAVQLGVNALKPKPRKKHSGPDMSGFSSLQFGRRS